MRLAFRRGFSELGRCPDVGGCGVRRWAAWFTYLTIRSQRKQIEEQRVFISEQSANLTLERAELRAALETRRWAQAKQVTMTYRTGGHSDRDSAGSMTGYDRWQAVVTNGNHRLEPQGRSLARCSCVRQLSRWISHGASLASATPRSRDRGGTSPMSHETH